MNRINWYFPLMLFVAFCLWIAIGVLAPRLWQAVAWLWRAL